MLFILEFYYFKKYLHNIYKMATFSDLCRSGKTGKGALQINLQLVSALQQTTKALQMSYNTY